ncbi:MAG: SPOR domain-containing protein [Deltaproteobacteria bacterium]|nr:SPOR domain-containing protein [Deltaproteobacteria bacterium]
MERAFSLPRALVAAVGVGVAFGAGMVIGGIGKAEAAAVDAVTDPVARAEARTKAYEQLIKGTQLSWHQELTAPEPALLPLPSKKAVVAPLAEEATASPMVDRALSAPEPEVVVKPVVAEIVDAGPDADDVVTRPDPKLLDAAMARVLGDKSVAAPVSDKRYAVQLASTGTEAAALILAADWATRGHAAVVVAADVPGKGTMYRVRIGGIASRAAADALKLRLGQGLVVTD